MLSGKGRSWYSRGFYPTGKLKPKCITLKGLSDVIKENSILI
jgi:hypothetical protein